MISGLQRGIRRDGPRSGRSEGWGLSGPVAGIAFLGFILLGCCDSVSGPEDSNRLSGLVGQWEWVSSCGGIAGGCITPHTSNTTRAWVFTSGNLFEWFQSGSLVLSGTYQIVEGDLNILNKRADFLWVDGVSTGLALELTGRDTLLTRSDCHDCYTDTWVRHRIGVY